MEKIAVYGGSFDPPHNGHKLLAENLSRFCGADRVIVIPAAVSPFKSGGSASGEHRLNMCKLLFDAPLFQVSDIEIKRGGKSYTIDTLTEIKKLYPDAQLYLFMGDDMLLSFNKWYKFDEILKLCKIVAACRTQKQDKLTLMEEYACEFLGGESNVLLCPYEPFEISSTKVRENLKKGVYEGISPKVYDYIISKELYK